jgi:hypothetical protein
MKIKYSFRCGGLVLNVENVHAVYEFCSTDMDGIKLTGEEKYAEKIKLFGDSEIKGSYPITEANFFGGKIFDINVKLGVEFLLGQLQAIHVNKVAEIKNNPNLRKKAIDINYARYKFDFSLNGELWADETQTQALYELMLLGRATEYLNPLKEVPSKLHPGKYGVAVDLSHGGIVGIDNIINGELRDKIETREKEKYAMKQAQTAPDVQ